MPGIVAFGPNFNSVDDVAHQAGEYMRIDDLFLCSKIYKNAIRELASKIQDQNPQFK
jgi:succinyl-diaminopimelate desuccinylase